MPISPQPSRPPLGGRWIETTDAKTFDARPFRPSRPPLGGRWIETNPRSGNVRAGVRLPDRLWADDGLKREYRLANVHGPVTSRPPLGGRWIETKERWEHIADGKGLPDRLWADDGLKHADRVEVNRQLLTTSRPPLGGRWIET